MRLTPQEPDIPYIGGFTHQNDIFDYREFAERLSNLITNIEEPLVIALDGRWGSGKSVFVKQWAGLLRERSAPVIEFDAFGNDHYEDAFLAVSAEIHASAKKILGGNKSATRRYLEQAKKAGVVLTPIGLRLSSRVATAGLLSLDDIEASGAAIKEASKVFSNEAGKLLEEAVSKRLREAAEERATLEAFKESLSVLAEKLSEESAGEGTQMPLVFIVDELDRCRPPFALSLNERIKHLFSVRGVCFILVTHLQELSHAVQGAYGPRFDSQAYLEKFYQLRVALPERADGPKSPRIKYIDHLWRSLDIKFPDYHQGQVIHQEITALINSYNLSLRQIERVLSHVALVSAAASPNHLIIPPGTIWLTYQIQDVCFARQASAFRIGDYVPGLRGSSSSSSRNALSTDSRTGGMGSAL